ncbi:hypothetical protein P3T23_000536 [Paraburkholderia sp. GAS448]|uniref:hypothetical protein n=1 Tax=Paraburkholderia sp. GAS448 TaxID=3035136 RepID=UPI003D23F337
MCYDLYFSFPTPVARQDIEAWFRKRRNYEVNDSAVYRNGDTGVYFVFAFERDESQPDVLKRIAFNLNYFRPHVFGLEAEPEVRAFVERFRPQIEDPQMNGMGTGPYSTEGFLAGWNRGNAFGYESILPRQTAQAACVSLPEAKLEAIWRWNHALADVQSELGESVFVPRIMMFKVDGALRSVAVWSDGIPTLLPEVDTVLVYRDELAPKTLFRQRVKDHCLIGHEHLDGTLAALSDEGYALKVRIPTYIEAPKSVRSFVGGLRKTTARLEGVAMDGVLSEELVQRYRG